MGDKGGKKDKDKSQKQKQHKQDQKAIDKRDKQSKNLPPPGKKAKASAQPHTG